MMMLLRIVKSFWPKDNTEQINKRINKIPLYQGKSLGRNSESSNAFDDLIKIRFILPTRL